MNKQVWYKRNWKTCLVSGLLIFASLSRGNDNDYTPAFSIDQTYKIKSELLDLLYDPEDSCIGCKSDGKGLVSKPPWLFHSANNITNHQEVTVYIVLTDAQVNDVDLRLNQMLGHSQEALELVTTAINQASEMLDRQREVDINMPIENLVQARRLEVQIIQLRSSTDELLLFNDLPGEAHHGLHRAEESVRVSRALTDSSTAMYTTHSTLRGLLATRNAFIILNAILSYAQSIKRHFENCKEWASIMRSLLPKSSG